MKKLIVAVLALMLAASLAFVALADADVRKVTKNTNIYQDQSTDSAVLRKLKKGEKVLIESSGDKWCGVLTEDPSGDGQTVGWVQTKYLKCDHNWSKWKVTKEATCTAKGSRTRTCSICGETETESIKATGHDWSKWKVTKEATCVVKGSRTRTCKTCGTVETEDFYADHTFGSWSMTAEPTCTETGLRVRTCKVCGKEDRQVLDKLPHDYGWQVIVETTDHSSGIRAKICKNCGFNGGQESFDPAGTLRRQARGEEVRQMQQLLVDQGYLNAGGADGIFGGGTEKALIQFQMNQGLTADGVAWPQTLQRLQHDFGPWQTVKAMTRNEPGERIRTCKDCGYVQHDTIEAGEIIASGSRGENVRALQQMLKQVGFDAGSFDGIYGRKLDAAFASFDAAHGQTFEAGKVRPADVDALVNAWLERSGDAMMMGMATSPVNMALSVTPSSDETTDDSATTYTWSLTNLGSKSATFTALLLNYGETPNFGKDNLVMKLDGQTLRPGAGNSLTGSFTVAKDWGEGSLNFAALAVDENSGLKWLSNTVTFEVVDIRAAKTVAPQPVEVNLNALADGIYPVSFDPGDVLGGTSGIFINAAHIYAMDIYDIVDVNNLAIGDTLVAYGREYAVESVQKRDGVVSVNGGLNGDGVELEPLGEDSNGYRVSLESDMATYTDLGVTTLVLADTALFNDAWDIEAEPVSVGYAGIVKAITESENTYFNQYNTTVRIEGGRVVEISREYVP